MEASGSAGACFDVAIVGGGFSGVMVAINVARTARVPTRIAIFERSGEYGRGAAYARRPEQVILNVPAGGMSAFPEAPSDFVDWLRRTTPEREVNPDAYVPRHLYGAYLAERLAEAQREGHDITCVRANITDVQRVPDGWALIDEAGRHIARGAFVVLAIGTLPPADPIPEAGELHDDPRYVRNPWAFLTHPDFAPSGDILIVGTGLTALDLISDFARAGHTNRVIVVSRHGRFPQPHAADMRTTHPVDPVPATNRRTLREIVALVRTALRTAAAEGIAWQDVIEGLRPRIADLWRGLDAKERQRFLRHVRPLYDPYRHRAPREVLARTQALIAGGQLALIAARVVAMRTDGDAFEVTLRERGADTLSLLRVAQVINCGGPANDHTSNADPLIANMLRRGDLAPDPIGMGLSALPDGRLLDARGIPHADLATIGWPMRGTLFETTAVRELRQQAQTLAAVINTTLRQR